MPRLPRRSRPAIRSEERRCPPVVRSVDFFMSSSKATTQNLSQEVYFGCPSNGGSKAFVPATAATGLFDWLRTFAGHYDARVDFALETEELLRIAPGERRHGRGVETLDRRDMADRIVFRHVIGVVGSEKDAIWSEHLDQRRQLVRREHDRIDIDALEISRRRLRQCAVTVRPRTPSVIDASGISAKIPATVYRKYFEPRVALEHAVEDQIVQRNRRLQRIAED